MRTSRSQIHDKRYNEQAISHRVIIPLYIPNEVGYYKDAFKIFKTCVTSLYRTTSCYTPVSVIANGCSSQVHEKLVKLQNNGLIDELLLETEQLGKINSIRRVLAACQEPFVTITDGDVMFLNDWEYEVAKLFEDFPKTTAVSPVPIFKTFNQYTTNIWLDSIWNSNVKFEKPGNPEALERFANSIGWSFLNDYQKNTILTISKGDKKAVVGCSHFCTTYKREALLLGPDKSSDYLLSGNSEELYLDKPTIKNDGYRLSCFYNYAFHLGNSWESWMDDELNSIKDERDEAVMWPSYDLIKSKPVLFFFKHRVFKYFLKKAKVYNYFLRKFNLPTPFIKYYYKNNE